MPATPEQRDPIQIADDAIARIRSVAEEVAAQRPAASSADDELAERRRDGELGRDWQVLQERIDMRRTTVRDILCGIDHSEEARAVRATLGENLARARSTIEEAAADPDSPAAQTIAGTLSAPRTELK